MSKAKHTPAPWRVEVPSDSNGFVNIKTGGNGFIGYYGEICEEPGKPTEVAMANARLIAEAPVMLEMLQRIVDLEPILAYPNDTHAEHQGEAQAVSTMLNDVKELIKKIEG